MPSSLRLSCFFFLHISLPAPYCVPSPYLCPLFFYQRDRHGTPGNIFIMDGGKVALIDCGQVTCRCSPLAHSIPCTRAKSGTLVCALFVSLLLLEDNRAWATVFGEVSIRASGGQVNSSIANTQRVYLLFFEGFFEEVLRCMFGNLCDAAPCAPCTCLRPFWSPSLDLCAAKNEVRFFRVQSAMFSRDLVWLDPGNEKQKRKLQVKQISMTQKLRLANLICKLERWNKPGGPSCADIAQDVSVVAIKLSEITQNPAFVVICCDRKVDSM